MSRNRHLGMSFLAAAALVLIVFTGGCHSGSSSTSAQFTPSATAAAPGLVKLVEKGRSGARVVVDVLIFGPEPALDLTAFRFGVKIGDSNLVRFVPQSSYTQNALVAGAGQTIAVEVDGASDPSLVAVTVGKNGGGAGNGIPGDAAVVIELAFDVQGSGTTTLTLGGLANTPPEAVDSTRARIAAVTFDTASAGVTGVTTGGGGY